jgi:hypothetical protein
MSELEAAAIYAFHEMDIQDLKVRDGFTICDAW